MWLAIAIAGCAGMGGFFGILENLFPPKTTRKRTIWIVVFALLAVTPVILVTIQEEQNAADIVKRDAVIAKIQTAVDQLRKTVPNCGSVSGIAMDKVNAIDTALATIRPPQTQTRPK